MLKVLFAVPVALALSASGAAALTLEGRAEVIDSSVLRLEGYSVYLLAVDSVESGQTCGIGGQPWDCWPAAVRALQSIVDLGPLACEVISGPNVFREVIARCLLGAEDVSAAFVASGFAVTIPAESGDYEDELAAAQAAGIGLWQGTFYPPAEWRRANGIFAGRPTFRPVAAAPQ